MIRTVIFDMDGVLVDTEPLHHEVNLQQFKDLGIEVPDEMYHTFTGNSNKMVYQKLKDSFQLPHEINGLIAAKNKLFLEAFDKKQDMFLMPGVKDLIHGLFENGVQLLVASSSEMAIINKVFERFGLDSYFAHKISGEDFPESKPNPAIFLKAVSYSKAPKEECIVIEDSTNGIAAAKAAGIFCIAYKGKGADTQNQSMADLVVDDFSKLDYEKIKNINS
ncbi:MAG TPA: HAD-IA family hydrolase [Flavobacterium sp.]|nr:HAD-IA family hydrolase [Flavobacterium sp.]